MVTKNQIKFITDLHQKKARIAQQSFFVEGKKGVQEFIDAHFELLQLFTTTDDFIEINNKKRFQISPNDLKKMSALTTPNTCLAVFKIPKSKEINTNNLILALDDIRDPGNLGTIIRLCDWFGIPQIICSHKTVDVFNPKVVQATMGSLGRVTINYVDLPTYLKESTLPVLGTFMNGNSIYKTKFPSKGIIVFGNEANGIQQEIQNLIQNKITIPRFGTLQQAESLNVATAVAIVLSECFRAK
jgi:RNA methyltransferase, TrmH family